MADELGALRLLIIDDNAQMRSMIGAVLAAAGVRHLHYAPDGQRGIEAISTFKPDVIFVDDEMPVMSGLDFIATVRRRPGPERRLPIIMVTSHADISRLMAVRDKGVNEFLRKPVTAATILKRLESVILSPRPFVECSAYVGPDRRRRDDPAYAGPRRRASDHG